MWTHVCSIWRCALIELFIELFFTAHDSHVFLSIWKMQKKMGAARRDAYKLTLKTLELLEGASQVQALYPFEHAQGNLHAVTLSSSRRWQSLLQ